MDQELRQYFLACPGEILQSYRRKYLKDDPRFEGTDATASAMVKMFADRRRVRRVLKQLEAPHHRALIALIQAGGIAGGSWLLQELVLAHGKSEDAWAEVLHQLGRKLLVFGNSHQAPPLFYVLPQPLLEVLAANFTKRLVPAEASSQDVRLSKDTNYNFPVGFSLVSVLTYLGQNGVRVTQKGEVFKKNLEEIAGFFGSLWGKNEAEKVMDWHRSLVQLLGLARVEDGNLVPDPERLDDWLDLSPTDRRELYLAAFTHSEPMMPWVLDVLSKVPGEGWATLDSLNTVYRRRYMGAVFQKRFVHKTYYLPPSGFYNPSPPLEFLQIGGLIERGLGSEGPLLRLGETGRQFLVGEPLGEPATADGFSFHLQPNFEVLAPAGLPLVQVRGLGAMAEFTSCDRVNGYLLTKETVREAMDSGWRRSELLRFLREGAAHGVPQNVDSTVDEWMTGHGDVEFHEAVVVTVAPEREEPLLEALREVAPGFRRMAPGVFAMAPEAREALVERLADSELSAVPWVRRYRLPPAPADRVELACGAIGERAAAVGLAPLELEPVSFPPRQMVVLQPIDARQMASDDSLEMFTALNGDGRPIAGLGHDLGRKPGAAGSGDLLKLSPAKTLDLVRAAINRGHDIEILYRGSGEAGNLGLTRVTPKSVSANGGVSSFSGLDHRRNLDTSFVVKRIQGIRLVR